MFTNISEETSRNYTKLYESGLVAMQKATQRQIDFSRAATEQIYKTNLDLANQANSYYINVMTDINQLLREIVVRALPTTSN